MGMDKRGGNVLRAAFLQQPLCQAAIKIAQLNRGQQGCQQPVIIGAANILRRRRGHPLGGNARAAQHGIDAFPPGIGHDQDGGALFPGAAGAARPVLQCFSIAGNFDMDDKAEARQINAARRDIGGHTHACTAIAQHLQRLIALILAMLTRKRDRGKAPFGQAGMQVAHIIARGAKQDGGFGIVKAQQIDDRIFNIGRGHGHRLIVDIAMAAIRANGGDAQGVLLIPLGQRHDGLGHGRGKQQGPAAFGGCIQNFFQIIAKAHVEHLVRLIQHRNAQCRQVKRAAFQMVAQAARCPHDNMGAMVQRAPFLAGIHAAHAGGNAPARLAIKPGEFAADLQGQFARRRNHQRQRLHRKGQPVFTGQQFGRHGQAKGHGFARAGLGRHDKIAALGLGLQHGGLNGGWVGIAARRQGVAEQGRQI